jgi:antirestriction protein ArdC
MAHTLARSSEHGGRFEEAHAKLVSAIEALISGTDWERMLKVASRFHRYSFGNIALITAQRADATQVAGYRTWKSLGRQVKRGEKGIAILTPCRRKRTEVDEITGEETSSTYVSGFTVAHMFDIWQTDGQELPEVRAELLDGAGPEGLWEALVAQVESVGFVVERAECGSANGRTNYATHTVTVRPDVSGAQACKTLAHELTHVLTHRERLSECRGVVEVEAESVAYLVCEARGVVSDGYSFPYVAVWAGGDSDLVRSTAERVITTAREILDRLGLIGGKPVEAAA